MSAPIYSDAVIDLLEIGEMTDREAMRTRWLTFKGQNENHDQIVETVAHLREQHITADSARAANVKAMSNGHVRAVKEPAKRGRKPKAKVEDIDSSRHTDGNVAPVNDAVTEELLADVVRFVKRFVVFPQEYHYLILALWILHARAIDAFDITPRLTIRSPEKESGKTRALELIKALLPESLFSINISPAALYRVVGDGKRPILFDEVDSIFSVKAIGDQGKEELRGILNSGYSRAGVVVRVKMAGSTGVIEEHPVFSPTALAAIGMLPDTVESRSVVISTRRRKADEHVDSFRTREVAKDAAPLIKRLKDWVPANEKLLRDARPDIPDEVNDRAADIWEPLLAIAELAGGQWATEARRACIEITSGREQDDQSVGVQLLIAILNLMAPGTLSTMTTSNILTELNKDAEAGYAGWRDGKGMRADDLAHYMKSYGIKSQNMRVARKDGSEQVLKGYKAIDFMDAWERYTTTALEVFAEYHGWLKKWYENEYPGRVKATLDAKLDRDAPSRSGVAAQGGK
jgi:hypothetical protein